MKNTNFDVNRLRVASPCPVGWESMKGNDRKRLCDVCEINVFNISSLTNAEVEELIGRKNGRLCIRLYRRTDGTVLTKDCPVGLRAVRKRIGKMVGITFAAILGLFSVAFSQKTRETKSDHVTVTRTTKVTAGSVITGHIKDQAGAVIPGVKIKLTGKGSVRGQNTTSDDTGTYHFNTLLPGSYKIEFRYPGFKRELIEDVVVGDRESVQVDLEMRLSSKTVTVGIFTSEPTIDVTSTTAGTSITSEMIEQLPH